MSKLFYIEVRNRVTGQRSRYWRNPFHGGTCPVNHTQDRYDGECGSGAEPPPSLLERFSYWLEPEAWKQIEALENLP